MSSSFTINDFTGLLCSTDTVTSSTDLGDLCGFCPKGYYCPDIFTQLDCPSADFCVAGTATPRSCMYSISCDSSNTAFPDHNTDIKVLLFFLLSVVVGLGIILPYFIKRIKKLLRNILNQKFTKNVLKKFRIMFCCCFHRKVYARNGNFSSSHTMATNSSISTPDSHLLPPSLVPSVAPATTAPTTSVQAATVHTATVQVATAPSFEETESVLKSPITRPTVTSQTGNIPSTSLSTNATLKDMTTATTITITATSAATTTTATAAAVTKPTITANAAAQVRNMLARMPSLTAAAKTTGNSAPKVPTPPPVVGGNVCLGSTDRVQSAVARGGLPLSPLEALALTSTSATANESFRFHPAEAPMHIYFHSLSMFLTHSGGNTGVSGVSGGSGTGRAASRGADTTLILDNISGEIKSARITGLMGPSGAGKTSLLSLLRGQAQFAHTEGTVMVNGKRVSDLSSFRDNIAYVPQDEIMYDALTVRENLLFTAVLFNKRGYVHTWQVGGLVTHCMQLLGLLPIAESVVGGSEVKGISGGQKKRVSIAMEMVKEASLFLLDEPTSGLDSASSLSLMTSLRALCNLGVTIVATLHQPRREILALVDDVLLLAPGGRVVYYGPTSKLESYFLVHLKYRIRTGMNIADFVMDVMAGYIKKETSAPHDAYESAEKITNDICAYWYTVSPYTTSHTHPVAVLDGASVTGGSDASESDSMTVVVIASDSVDTAVHEVVVQGSSSSSGGRANTNPSTQQQQQRQLQVINIHRTARSLNILTCCCCQLTRLLARIFRYILNFVKVLSLIFQRQLYLYYRTRQTYLTDLVILMITGATITLLFGTMIIQPSDAPLGSLNTNTLKNSKFVFQVITYQLTYALLVMTPGLRLLGNDRGIRLREEQSGVDYLPYYCGKLLSSFVLEVLVFPIAFLVGYYPFCVPAGRVWDYYITLLLLQVAVYSLCHFVSVVCKRESMSLVMAGAIVVLWAFGGLISNATGVFFTAMQTLSPFHKSFQLTFLVEFQTYPAVFFNVHNMINPLTDRPFIDNDLCTVLQQFNIVSASVVDSYNEFITHVDDLVHTRQLALIVYCVVVNVVTLAYLAVIARDHFKWPRHVYESVKMMCCCWYCRCLRRGQPVAAKRETNSTGSHGSDSDSSGRSTSAHSQTLNADYA